MLHESWEAIIFHYADEIEIVISPVLGRRFCMKGESSFKLNLLFRNSIDQGYRLRASLTIEYTTEQLAHLRWGYLGVRKQVLFHTHGIANNQAAFRGQRIDRPIQRHPVGTGVHL